MANLEVLPSVSDGEQMIPTIRDMDRGLSFVLRSYLLLVLMGGFGLVYFGSITEDGWRVGYQRFGDSAETIREGLVLALSLSGALAYLFLLVGQWWCLARASSYHNAKETALACLFAFLLTTVFFGASIWVGGLTAFLSWEHGLRQLHQNLFGNPALTLKFVGAIVLLFWFCCFNHFLSLVNSFHNQEPLKRVDRLLVFLCGVFGLSAGLWTYPGDFDWRYPAQVVLGICWAVCLVMHLWRLQSVRSVLRNSLGIIRRQLELGQQAGLDAAATPQRLSGVRRVLESIRKKLEENACTDMHSPNKLSPNK